MTFPALITPLGADGRPDNSLPGNPPMFPDNSLPGGGGRPDNSLPGGGGGRPDNSLPPVPGVWPPPPVVWPPKPPISIGIDPDLGIELPIYLPGTPGVWPPLPPVEIAPGEPSNPIVLPPPPEGGVILALVLRLPAAPKNTDGSQPALLWYGPGTVPTVVQLPPPATPK